ncbi:MAG: hypothetical protein CM1200mP21_02960 [Candidatus Poseidoniales archaeon]|nr:MAG: hypothetical protein CM1200mP21_02960 [Candidatus Poseidoniales archaeon]
MSQRKDSVGRLGPIVGGTTALGVDQVLSVRKKREGCQVSLVLLRSGNSDGSLDGSTRLSRCMGEGDDESGFIQTRVRELPAEEMLSRAHSFYEHMETDDKSALLQS